MGDCPEQKEKKEGHRDYVNASDSITEIEMWIKLLLFFSAAQFSSSVSRKSGIWNHSNSTQGTGTDTRVVSNPVLL
jgi:hypothetical protein